MLIAAAFTVIQSSRRLTSCEKVRINKRARLKPFSRICEHSVAHTRRGEALCCICGRLPSRASGQCLLLAKCPAVIFTVLSDVVLFLYYE